MTLDEFLKSHDQALIAIERLKKMLRATEDTESLVSVITIERHLTLLETDYIDFQMFLIEGGEV